MVHGERKTSTEYVWKKGIHVWRKGFYDRTERSWIVKAAAWSFVTAKIYTSASRDRKTEDKKPTPSVQIQKTEHDRCERKGEEKIHINATCMCITYRISFVCGLTNPREKERINQSMCTTKTSHLSGSSQPISQECLQTRSKPEAVELCRVAAPLNRLQKCCLKSFIRRGKYFGNPFSQWKRLSSAGRTWTAALH